MNCAATAKNALSKSGQQQAGGISIHVKRDTRSEKQIALVHALLEQFPDLLKPAPEKPNRCEFNWRATGQKRARASIHKTARGADQLMPRQDNIQNLTSPKSMAKNYENIAQNHKRLAEKKQKNATPWLEANLAEKTAISATPWFRLKNGISATPWFRLKNGISATRRFRLKNGISATRRFRLKNGISATPWFRLKHANSFRNAPNKNPTLLKLTTYTSTII